MPSDPMPPVQISFTHEFKRNLRQLSRKYRRIRSDLQPILDQLAEGARPGDQVSRVSYDVFKVRVKNSDASRGKSGGYRVIYHVKSASDVVLITLYSKTEQSDVSPDEIRRIILDVEKNAVSDAGSSQSDPEKSDTESPE